MILKRVVLPQPLAPTRPIFLPLPNLKLMSLKTEPEVKLFSNLVATIIVGGILTLKSCLFMLSELLVRYMNEE